MEEQLKELKVQAYDTLRAIEQNTNYLKGLHQQITQIETALANQHKDVPGDRIE